MFDFRKTFKNLFETDNRTVSQYYYPAADKNEDYRPAAPSSKISQDNRAYAKADYSTSRSGENETQKHEPGEKYKKELLFAAFPQTLFFVKRNRVLVVFSAQSP